MCIHVPARAPSRAPGFLSQIENMEKIRFVKASGFCMIPISEKDAEPICSIFHEYASPIGTVILIPSMPINLSAARDARQMARSKPICIAPASRATSPPMVVGRKFDANKPVKVSAVLL